ncbi:MAG: DUF559 domain-containing protein [Nocardioidaceae bacterium]
MQSPPTPKAVATELDIRRPFTRATAIAAGISPSSLKGSNFRRIFRGVYVHASVPAHPLQRLEAALLVHPPTAFASHVSAARVYGLPVPSRSEEHVSVFTQADRRRRPGVRNHVVPAGTPVELVRGVRVSAPEAVFIELAAIFDLVDLVVAGDALVRTGHTTPEQLRAVCAASRDSHAPQARRAAAYVREHVDSPMETRLRMLIVLAGLPEPKINHKVYYEDGRLRYRFDLSYPDLKLVVEYDGRQHRDDLDQWDHDTRRGDWCHDNGWRIVSVFSRGIYRRPDQTLERVHTALKSRGCTTLARTLSEEWRAHFPVRP